VKGSQVLGIRAPGAGSQALAGGNRAPEVGIQAPVADRLEPAIRAVVGIQAVEGSLAEVGSLGPGQARLGRVEVGVAAYLPSLNLLLFSSLAGLSLDQKLFLLANFPRFRSY